MSPGETAALSATSPSGGVEADHDFEAPGLALRVRRVPGLPVVSVRVLMAGGARRESLPGLAYLTGRMLAEGSRRRSWKQIAEDLEDRGMLMATSATFEVLGLSLDALADDWVEALEWAAELVLEPAFPEERCAWVRRQIAAELESLGDQPEVRSGWAFMEQLYAPHPRGRRLQGDGDTLLGLTPADCAAFHAQSLERRRLVAVAGDIDEEAVTRRLEELFALKAGASGSGEPTAADLPEPGNNGARREVQLQSSEQAHLYMGHTTVARRHPDLAALEIAGVILGAGSGLTGRIPQRIREQEGLAYSTYVLTAIGAGIDPGRLVAYVGTSPETAAQAESGVREELERLCQDGVEEHEVEEARSYLLGREPFRRETARQWSDLLAEAEFYGLPVDDPSWREGVLRAPDRAQIEAVIRRHLKPRELRVTLGLPTPEG